MGVDVTSAHQMRVTMKIALVAVVLSALACVCVSEEAKAATPPNSVEGSYFLETFSDPIEGRWVKSTNKMYNGNAGAKREGEALVLTQEAKRYGLAAPFTKQTVPGKDLVLQYELKHSKPLECGGAYLKFLEGQPDLAQMEEKSSYTVMFGPDKCGSTNKVHLILRFKNAKTGEYKEHHLKNPPQMKNDDLPHLYTAVLRADNSFELFVDQASVKAGSLTSESDWELPFQPPQEIDDPADKKPADWVDNEKMPDPAAKKPDDWDEDAPQQIPDAEAKKPDDWNEEEDGAYEAPMIDNPKCKTGCGTWKRPMKANPEYKGKWSAPMITNPAYKGVWKPKRIANPGYYEVKEPVKDLLPIGAVAVEVWLHKPSGVGFDNILVVDDLAKATDFGEKTWKVRSDALKAAKKAKDEKPRAEAREKKLKEGGFWNLIEEYTKMAAELFAKYPWVSFPALLLLFFLVFKLFRPGEREKPPARKPRVMKEAVKEDAPEGKDVTTEEKKGGDEGVRQRKGKESKEEEEEETEKDK